jgi:hypothetical protein
MSFGNSSNDAKHSPQTGTRLALVSSLSQMRHPAGKNTLTIASLASASQPRTPRRRSACTPLDEFSPATPPAIYSFFLLN